MQQEISALTEQLAPAGADEIGQCIQGLMSGGMRISETITAANPVEEYRLSLRNVPVYGLRRAYVKLKRGEYENINRAFIPLPAELAAPANAECRLIREDRIRKQETLRAIEDSISRTLPSSHGLMDLRVSQRERVIELAEKGFVRTAEGVDHLEFAHLPNRGNCLPVLTTSGQLTRSGRRSPSASTAAESRLSCPRRCRRSAPTSSSGCWRFPIPARSPPNRWRIAAR